MAWKTARDIRVIIAFVIAFAVVGWVARTAGVQEVHVLPACIKMRIVEHSIYCFDKNNDVIWWEPYEDS